MKISKGACSIVGGSGFGGIAGGTGNNNAAEPTCSGECGPIWESNTLKPRACTLYIV